MKFSMKLKRGVAIALSSLMVSGAMGTVGMMQSAVFASEYSTPIGSIVDENTVTVGPGMVQTVYDIEGSRGAQKVYKLEANPFNDFFEIETGISNEKVLGKEKVTDMAKRANSNGNYVIGAINGDFYNPTDGVPIGIMIKNGEIVKAYSQDSSWNAIGFTPYGNTIIGSPKFNMSFSVEGGEAVKIDEVNSERNADELVLYTSKYSTNTETNEYGTEVVLKVTSGAMSTGGSMTAVVEEVIDGKGSVPLIEGKVVLSGHGKADGELRKKLKMMKSGDKVEMSFDVGEPWSNATEAIGGREILVKDGVVQQGLETVVHPRTAIGVKADGNIIVLAVDGRQSGFSEGVTLPELAAMMKEMGAINALNLDGGGSTTFASRQPGEEGVTIVNSPSGIEERRNANGLLFISTAPKGKLSKLVISPNKLRILAGEEYYLGVKGVDQYYNPALLTDTVLWGIDDGIGVIDTRNRFTASETAGSGKIKASSSGASGEIAVEVVSKIDKLNLSHNVVSVEPGGSLDLDVKAYSGGKKVISSDSSFSWTVEGDIGSVNSDGVFKAKDGKGLNGKVIVSYNGVKSEVKVSVGKLPTVLENFESGIGSWKATGSNYNSVGATIVSLKDSKPVHSGSNSLEVSYDFKGKTGTSGVYAGPEKEIEISGYPDKIGMWVYGDGNGHWLRGKLKDGSGSEFDINFTGSDPGVDWTGWKYVEAEVPKGKALPIKLSLAVRYMKTGAEKKADGAIYIDDIVATYGISTPDEKPVEPPKENSVFQDIEQGSWYEEHVMRLYEKGIVDGILEGNVLKYYPENNITREQFAKLIVSAIGLEEVPDSQFKFADDNYISDWAKSDVYTAYEAGLIKGFEDEEGNIRFNANWNITRAEIVTIIGRSLGEKPSKAVEFKDKGDIQDWAIDYVALAVEKGIVTGYTDNTFRPSESATRSEVAKIISAIVQ